VVIFHEY